MNKVIRYISVCGFLLAQVTMLGCAGWHSGALAEPTVSQMRSGAIPSRGNSPQAVPPKQSGNASVREKLEQAEPVIVRGQYTPFNGKPLPGKYPQRAAPRVAAQSSAPPASNQVYLPNSGPTVPVGRAATMPGPVNNGNSSFTFAPPPAANYPNYPGRFGRPPTLNDPGRFGMSPDTIGKPVIPPPQDRYIDLEAIVTETQTGRFSMGLGVNSNAGLVGSFILDERNFDWRRWPTSWEDVRNGSALRGDGQRFRLEAMPGNQVSRYMATFTEPFFMDSPVSLSLSAFFFNRRYLDWDEERTGGRIGMGYRLTPDLSVSASIQPERITIFNEAVPTPADLQAVLGDNTAISAEFKISHNTRDNNFLPTEGHLFELSYEQTVGTFDYPKVILDARQYFLLHERADQSGRHVLSLLGRFGVTGSNTPVYDRFFVGGFSSIRGFEFRGATPRVLGVGVGGDMLLYGSVEYMLPVTADDMLRAVVFCDFGTVEETVGIDWGDFRVSPGVGLRITVPAMGPAPIALDLAFPIAFKPGDEIQNFSFFVGFGR